MPWGVAKVPVQAVMQTARSEKRCTLLLALLIHFISGMRMIRKDLFVLIPGQAGIWTTLSPFGAAEAVVMLFGRWGFAWCEAAVLLPACACPGCVGVGEENYSLQVRNTQVFLCPAAPQVAESPPGEVWGPSLVPVHTGMLRHSPTHHHCTEDLRSFCTDAN